MSDTLNITIPSSNFKLAAAIGRALQEYGEDQTPARVGGPTITAPISGRIESVTVDGKQYAIDSGTGEAVAYDAGPGDDEETAASVFADKGARVDDGESGREPGSDDESVAASMFANSDILDQDTIELATVDLDPVQPSGPLDDNGVEKDDKFCANAAKPFYASGARKGQWKMKGGAAGPGEEAYDAWYAGQPRWKEDGEVEGKSAETTANEVDSEAAFGNSGQNAQVEDVPVDGGQYMKWVSEKQAAGLLTQPDITKAFENCDASTGDLFGPDVAEVVANLYRALSAVIAARSGA